jgi:hypothetical protein
MKTILAILQLFPAIIAAVQAIENAIPVSQQGKVKLDLVLDTVKTAYDAEESVRKDFSWDKLAGVVVTIVGKVVATFNALGVFKKG